MIEALLDGKWYRVVVLDDHGEEADAAEVEVLEGPWHDRRLYVSREDLRSVPAWTDHERGLMFDGLTISEVRAGIAFALLHGWAP